MVVRANGIFKTFNVTTTKIGCNIEYVDKEKQKVSEATMD